MNQASPLGNRGPFHTQYLPIPIFLCNSQDILQLNEDVIVTECEEGSKMPLNQTIFGRVIISDGQFSDGLMLLIYTKIRTYFLTL